MPRWVAGNALRELLEEMKDRTSDYVPGHFNSGNVKIGKNSCGRCVL